MIKYREYCAEQIRDVVEGVAKLRIEIFREFPYLYDGEMEDERVYVESIADISSAYVVVALDDDDAVIGAITFYSLEDAQDEVKDAFAGSNIDMSTLCYFGEVMLMKETRGGGIGRSLIEYAERYAVEREYKGITLCTIDREPNHSQQPSDYRPISQLLNRRGYNLDPKLKANIVWQESDGVESDHTLSFWFREV